MEPTINKKKNSGLWIVLAVILVVSIAAIIIIVTYSNSPAQRYLRQLEVADRYLEDLDYEQAVAAYQAAIAIDPRQPDAYLGLAEAYVGMGDYEAALSVLEEGYRLTQDSRIAEKMEEIEALLNPVTDAGSEPATEEGTESASEEVLNENDWKDGFAELQKMIEEWNQDGYSYKVPYMRSREEMKEAFAPTIAKAEELISIYEASEDSYFLDSVSGEAAYVYRILYECNLKTGDMERTKYYYDIYEQRYQDNPLYYIGDHPEYYNDYGEVITSKTYIDGNKTTSTKYDSEVVGELEDVYTYEYNEYGQCIKETQEKIRGIDTTHVFIDSYDGSGRLISKTYQILGDSEHNYVQYFDYISSDEAVRRMKWSNEEEWEEVKFSIDKWGYGHLIE